MNAEQDTAGIIMQPTCIGSRYTNSLNCMHIPQKMQLCLLRLNIDRALVGNK